MNVKTILAEWLKAHGHDGLMCVDDECGCEIADLMPCDSPCGGCEPAYRGPPNEEYGGEWAMYLAREAVAIAQAEGKT